MSDSYSEKEEAVKNQLDGKLEIIDTSPIDDMVAGAENDELDKRNKGLPNIHDAGHS